ncbi:hypothetical protein C0W28_03840 [Photobacterium kishitanii]|nr:hypothetical protein C0W28_03840 [Photobacterium kishitanii]
MNIKILKTRYSMKLTQSEMALLLGVSKKRYIRVESGSICPKADFLYNLSGVADKNIAYFYHNQDGALDNIMKILKINGSKIDIKILTLFELMLSAEIEMNNEKWKKQP